MAQRSIVIVLLLAVGCAAPRPTDHRGFVHSSRPPVQRYISTPTTPPQVRPTRLVAHEENVRDEQAGALFVGPTSVDELVAYASANNPEIRAARSKAQSMISRVAQGRSLDDPMLSATVFLEEIQTAAGPQEVMLSLSQKFPWFGKRDARGEVAYHDAQIAFAELADVELDVIQQVKLAYYDLYFLNESLAVYRDLEKKLKDVIEITRTRFETNAQQVGLETVYQAEVTLHKLQITLVKLDQAKAAATAKLARALHLPNGLRLDIQPSMETSSMSPRQLDLLVAMLDECHPQLKARRQAIIRDNWSVNLAQKNYHPDFTLGFNWNEIGSSGLSRVANGQDAYSLMVGVNLPVYRAKRHAALREARFKSSQSSQQYEATWDTLRADVEKLHAEIAEHDHVLRILDKDILRKAEQTFELSREAFRVNRIGFQQLIDNYESLLRFRIDFHFRTTSRAQAIARLERAVGCGVTQWQKNGEPAPLPMP